MKDIRKAGTLFKFAGKLYETIGHWQNEIVVIVQPVKEEDYTHCECGRPLSDQTEHYSLAAPNLQKGIEAVYVEEV